MAKTNFNWASPSMLKKFSAAFADGGSFRDLERLTALRLGLGGEHTLEQIAQAVGRSRSRIIEWMRIARTEGVAALLSRHQGHGRKPQVKGAACKGLRQAWCAADGNGPKRPQSGSSSAMALS